VYLHYAASQSDQKDSFATLQDPANDKGEHDLASYHTLSSMILPWEKMNFFTEYWEKWLL
jgi:hypothetical protein